MLFKVRVGYSCEFVFTDGTTALNFAVMAKAKSVEDEDVTIRLEYEQNDEVEK